MLSEEVTISEADFTRFLRKLLVFLLLTNCFRLLDPVGDLSLSSLRMSPSKMRMK